MYTINFQKCDLNHVHLLLFLRPSNKYPSPNDIDRIISTEIPSHEDDPELYRLEQNHMVHNPRGNLGRGSPCMKKGNCSRFYTKNFQPCTLLDADDYLVNHRRDNDKTISKNGVIIDSRNIVPCNLKLLRKFQTKNCSYGCFYQPCFLIIAWRQNCTL